jgi:hypothetical protein
MPPGASGVVRPFAASEANCGADAGLEARVLLLE